MEDTELRVMIANVRNNISSGNFESTIVDLGGWVVINTRGFVNSSNKRKTL